MEVWWHALAFVTHERAKMSHKPGRYVTQAGPKCHTRAKMSHSHVIIMHHSPQPPCWVHHRWSDRPPLKCGPYQCSALTSEKNKNIDIRVQNRISKHCVILIPCYLFAGVILKTDRGVFHALHLVNQRWPSYNNRNPALGVLWSWHRVASPPIEIPIQIWKKKFADKLHKSYKKHPQRCQPLRWKYRLPPNKIQILPSKNRTKFRCSRFWL